MATEDPLSQYHGYFKPNFSDTLKLKLDSFTIGKYLHPKLNLQNPYINRRHNDQYEMAFDPGPSLDRMPNAIVVTPGVKYTLKIVKPGTQILKRNSTPPPFKLPRVEIK